MIQDNVVKLIQPAEFSDPLTEVLREGARALLAQAVEAEVAAFLSGHADQAHRRRPPTAGAPWPSTRARGRPAWARFLCARRGFATALGLVRAASGSRPRSCRPTPVARRASRF